MGDALLLLGERFESVLRVTIHATLLVILVVAVHRFLGRWIAPQWRYVMWCVVIARLLAPGGFEITQLASEPQRQPWERAATFAFVSETESPTRPLADATTAGNRSTTIPMVDEENAANIAESRPVSISPWSIAGAVWAAGGMLLALTIVVKHVVATRMILRDANPAPQWIAEIFAEAKREMRVAAWPVVLVSEAAMTPMLAGAVRPKILLPSELVTSASKEDMRLFLLHELAHIRAGDIWLSWVWCVALCVHWFNPAMWWTGARIRRDREAACDARVVARVGEAQRGPYCHALLNALNHRPEIAARPLYGLAGIVETRIEIERRIAMITQPRKSRFATAAVATAAVAAFGFVQIGSMAQQTEDVQLVSASQNPFAAIDDESALGEARDKAAAEGDLIRACEAEMRRVKARDEAGNVWKDKIDLVSVYSTFAASGHGADNAAEAKALIAQMEQYAAAHADDADYTWRVWHLCATIAESVGDEAQSREHLAKAIAAYPRVRYSEPSKHSKFQHLVNEMAMKIWSADGVEAAESYCIQTWNNDRRFVYFYWNPWEQRLEQENLDVDRLETMRARMGEKPPLTPIALTVTEDGIRIGDRRAAWDEIERELAQIENPYDHFISLNLESDEISVGAWRETKTRCQDLVNRFGFDHLSDKSGD